MPNTISSIQDFINSINITFNHNNGFNITTGYASASSPNYICSIIEVLVLGVFTMAQANLYIVLSHTTENQKMDTFFKGFTMWLSGFLGYLWMLLWIFLWSLLFVIPGIIKAFSYSQMFYILAENPDIGVIKAMNLSKTMTKGFKGDLFVMALSFLGWDILCLLTFGILTLWVNPYKYMSYVNAYHAMKEHALRAGDLTPEDFVTE